MICKERGRTACILHKNKSRTEMGEGVLLFKTIIEFEKDECPNLNKCKIRGFEPRLERYPKLIEYKKGKEILKELPDYIGFIYPLEATPNKGLGDWFGF